MKSSDDIIFEIDEKGYFAHYWARDPEVLFVPADRIEGMRVTEAFPGEFGKNVEAVITRAYAEKTNSSITYKDPSGKTSINYQADLKYVVHPNDKPSLIVHIRETEVNTDLRNKLQETSRLLNNLFKIPG